MTWSLKSQKNLFSPKSWDLNSVFSVSFYLLYFIPSLFCSQAFSGYVFFCRWCVWPVCPSSVSEVANCGWQPIQLLWHHSDCLFVCPANSLSCCKTKDSTTSCPTLHHFMTVSWRGSVADAQPWELRQQHVTLGCKHCSLRFLYCGPDVFLIDVFAFVALCFCWLCQTLLVH